MESLSQITLSDTTIRLLVVLFVILIEQKFAIDASYHPGTLWRFIAQKLSLKTAKGNSKQQRLSGAISTILLVMIGMFIALSIITFATYSWFFDIIFLLLALHSFCIIKSCKSIYFSLKNNRKNLAREQLNQLCIRDTAQLSSMGIVKGTIEGSIQQFSLNYFIPLFLYLLFGSVALVMYALFNSLARYWNPKQQKFKFFGRFANYLIGTISLPFHVLLAVLISILFGFKHLSIKRNSWHRFGTGALLTTTASVMNRELGGAVMYNGIKIRRPKLGPRHFPNETDIKHIIRLLIKARQSILILVFISFLFTLIITL